MISLWVGIISSESTENFVFLASFLLLGSIPIHAQDERQRLRLYEILVYNIAQVVIPS